MACCEANYFRLLALFPDLHSAEQRRIGLSLGSEAEVLLTVLERTSYTTLLSISQRQISASEPLGTRSERTDKSVTVRWFKPPILTVRLYHDAQIAEVITYGSNRGVRPKNAYPNQHMFQPDEKRQWNHFLEEWLVLCRQHGYAVGEPVPTLDTTCE
ncbi:MAG: DUF1249 domain-containing protein [Gammaproteobacteria bacterium]|nr:DUF1249 domain-containing protein [Gammaproteobacteria bacterium]MBQ0841184.1 DUF1249 domain-containing protein [Gammaproteobacteria bacterium]